MEHRPALRALMWGAAVMALLTLGACAPGVEVGGLTAEQLAEEKVRQEILDLEYQRGFPAQIPGWAAVLTAFVAIVGVGLTLRQQRADRLRQLDEDNRLRQAAIDQREDESRRRFDEGFRGDITSLDSASAAVRTTAAVSLLTYLEPEYKRFHRKVLLAVAANLKVPQQSKEVTRYLVRVFEAALRLQIDSLAPGDRELALYLARTHLARIDLSGLDMHEADLGFADLTHADLRNANLSRVQAIEADFSKARLSDANLSEARMRGATCLGTMFHSANLVSARLEQANLERAEFYQAHLQSAHLDEARLVLTSFAEADLNDTFFRGLTEIDEASMASLAKAKNWRNAHFDEPVRARIAVLAGEATSVIANGPN